MLKSPTTEFRAQVLETHQYLDVKPNSNGQLVIALPKELAGIDHPVIRISPAGGEPARYEDEAPVEPVKPGVMPR